MHTNPSAPGCMTVCLLLLGSILSLVGLVLLCVGGRVIDRVIMNTMALHPGSDRLESWLHPPVQPHLHGYGFHVTNPEEVMMGLTPILQEVGPFTYKAVTVKDSIDQDTGEENLKYNDDGETLTYRTR